MKKIIIRLFIIAISIPLVIIFIALLGYVFLLISKLFLSSPSISPVDKYFPPSGFLNIAHRGGAGIAPENTLYAFSNALNVGADVLEMDVHKTLDDKLVVIHDSRVDRTTDKSGLISEMTLKEIKELDAAYHFKAEENYPLRGKGIRIPTLAEVFLAFPSVRMVIEIKPKEEDFKSVTLFCAALEEHKRKPSSLIASFSDAVINKLKEDCSGVKTVAAIGESTKFLFLNKLNLTHLYEAKNTAFEIPLLGPSLPMVGELTIYSKDFLKEANEKNLAVHLWTINEEAEMKKLIGDEVQGILTDYPDKLANLIKK